MSADDRELNFERALARQLRGSSPDSSCPDAEILAAYHEHTLPLDEMAHWKQHISACARCQESLALVEQTEHLSVDEWEREHVVPSSEEAASPAARRVSASSIQRRASQAAAAQAPIAHAGGLISRGRAHPPWRWVVPLGAAAAAVIVWVGVQEMRTRHLQQLQQGATQIAENRAPAPQPAAPQAPPTTQLNREEASPQRTRNAQPQPSVALSAPPPPSSPSATVKPSPMAAAKLPAAEPKNSLAARSSAEVRSSQAPLAPVASYVEKQDAGDQVATQSSTVAQAKSDLDEAAKKEQTEKPPAPAAAEAIEVQAPTINKATAFANGRAAGLLLLAREDSRYILAPGQKQAWRLGNGGSIEHSSDRGKTWKQQTSGVTSDLTAGSATSDTVCWVVGKAGTVLLTTDGGKHWNIITSPIPTDLGGIHATDATHASLWDLSNRNSFETTDGGATWTRTANE
jgi:hypothetical protein